MNGPVGENVEVVFDPVVEDEEIVMGVVEERNHCWRDDERGGVHGGGALLYAQRRWRFRRLPIKIS